jgi:hypothetical protein
VIDAARGIRDAEDRIRALVESGTALAIARADTGYHGLQTRRRPVP